MFCVDFENNNCVKTSKDKPILSAAGMYARDSSFWQQKVYLPRIRFSSPSGPDGRTDRRTGKTQNAAHRTAAY